MEHKDIEGFRRRTGTWYGYITTEAKGYAEDDKVRDEETHRNRQIIRIANECPMF